MILLANLAKAWLVLLLLLIVVVVVILGSIWYLFHTVFPETPHNNPNSSNNASVDPYSPVYVDSSEWPWTPDSLANAGALEQPTNTFSIQYGFNSTNTNNPVWAKTGTNLVITQYWPYDDPVGSNNVNWEMTNTSYPMFSILVAPINTSNCYDFVYQDWGWLYHMQYTNVDGNYILTFNTNLNLVVNVSTDMLNWSPIYTNTQVGADFPYTFSDTQATTPSRFYRVTTQ